MALTEILKTTILSLYNPGAVSNEYVSEVGYAWDRDKLPNSLADTDTLVSAIKGGTVVQIVSAMGIEGAPHPVNTYLEKLSSEVKGTENEPKLDALKRSFLTAIAGKMLAKAKLNAAGKVNGLADRELEVVLGRKLMQQKMEGMEGKGTLITPEQFIEQNDVNAAVFYGRLNIKVKELCAAKAPQAVNTIIDLIPRLGEPKELHKMNRNEKIFNVRSMDEILTAA